MKLNRLNTLRLANVGSTDSITWSVKCVLKNSIT